MYGKYQKLNLLKAMQYLERTYQIIRKINYVINNQGDFEFYVEWDRLPDEIGHPWEPRMSCALDVSVIIKAFLGAPSKRKQDSLKESSCSFRCPITSRNIYSEEWTVSYMTSCFYYNSASWTNNFRMDLAAVPANHPHDYRPVRAVKVLKIVSIPNRSDENL